MTIEIRDRYGILVSEVLGYNVRLSIVSSSNYQIHAVSGCSDVGSLDWVLSLAIGEVSCKLGNLHIGTSQFFMGNGLSLTAKSKPIKTSSIIGYYEEMVEDAGSVLHVSDYVPSCVDILSLCRCRMTAPGPQQCMHLWRCGPQR